MSDILQLLENNRVWSEGMKEAEPDFFDKLSKRQKPEYLWIGCSDSRVPANEIVGLPSGAMFVHRNIANVVPHSDLNCLSVIQYAVEVLEVEHIVVTGHYGCGGVKAAMGNDYHGQIDNWLVHIKDIYRKHYEELQMIKDQDKRAARLCELNVIHQVGNVGRTSIVQRAWNKGKSLTLHGWIYSLEDGILNDLGVEMDSHDSLHPAYHLNT